MKFLIIRLSSIGDILLTTPVVRCLKKQLPGLQLHYLTKPFFTPVLAGNPYIDQIHLYQNDGVEVFNELKKENFDYVIDLQHDDETKRIKSELKFPALSYNPLRIEKFIFKKLKWNVMPKNVHVVDRYMNAVSGFGVDNDGAGLDYFIPDRERVTEKDIPASHHSGYIGLVIGASFYTKKLPAYKLQELCRKIDHPIILLGAKKEYPEGYDISSFDPVKVYNACGKFSLDESADLLQRSKLVIAHDTGLMHIAAALKKQIIVIWGSTTPSFGMVPYYGKIYLASHPNPFDNVQVHKLWCRPCTDTGRDQCPQGHFKCMKKISIDEIVAKVNMRLGRGV